jgi:hypothetical protein
MIRTVNWLLALALVCTFAYMACAKPGEITDPKQAMADPDFSVQGEYVGEGELPNGSKGKLGAQVIAQGGGGFRVVLYAGGLPGAGWKRDDVRFFLDGKTEDGVTTLSAENLGGTIADGKLTITDGDGKKTAQLSRTQRKSCTLGEKPPEGAVVLFDGSSNENFPGGKISEEGTLTAGVTSKPTFDGSYRLHLEFRLSWMPAARGQGRSNSGVYLHDCYECQVLDSFGLEGKDNECGGFYKVRQPDVNMCLPPMQWQTYDFDFTAPKYEDGKKVANARATVRHNGVVIHKDLEMPGGTPGRQKEGPGPRPLYLQGHGNLVQYRNVWVAPK